MYQRVAIIDDDPINNLICEKVIQRCRFSAEVLSFASAAEALSWLQITPAAQWPEMLFLDINLPFMDGWEFLERLPQRPAVRIYILSSSVSEEDRDKAIRHPRIQDFMIKPLTIEKLTDLPQQT